MQNPLPGRAAAPKAAAAVLLLAFLLLFLRAGHRLLHPEVWVEDAYNLDGWDQRGLASLAEPVNGYLVLVPKLITHLSASLSIYYYPLISTVLAWGVILFVLLAVARSPLRLQGGVLLAVACLLVPVDPEVFGLPLYTFWWTSLLLFAAVFWDPDAKEAAGARLVCIALAALSSPVVVVVVPLFWLRAWLLRERPVEIGLAVVASLCAAVQLAWLWQAGVGAAPIGARFEIQSVWQIVRQFFGAYLVGNLSPKAVGTFAVLLSALCVAAVWRHRRTPAIWCLSYLWGVAVLMASVRSDLAVIHPQLAGPRYFFFPYILLSWFLLQVFALEKDRRLRFSVAACLVLSLLNAVPVLSREHDPLRWQEQLEACSRTRGEFVLFGHYDGLASHAMRLPVTGEKCAQLLDADRLYRMFRGP